MACGRQLRRSGYLRQLALVPSRLREPFGSSRGPGGAEPGGSGAGAGRAKGSRIPCSSVSVRPRVSGKRPHGISCASRPAAGRRVPCLRGGTRLFRQARPQIFTLRSERGARPHFRPVRFLPPRSPGRLAEGTRGRPCGKVGTTGGVRRLPAGGARPLPGRPRASGRRKSLGGWLKR